MVVRPPAAMVIGVGIHTSACSTAPMAAAPQMAAWTGPPTQLLLPTTFTVATYAWMYGHEHYECGYGDAWIWSPASRIRARANAPFAEYISKRGVSMINKST